MFKDNAMYVYSMFKGHEEYKESAAQQGAGAVCPKFYIWQVWLC